MAFLIPVAIPLNIYIYIYYMLGWETRTKLIQEHRKCVSEINKKLPLLSIVVCSASLCSEFLTSLKAANQIEGLNDSD